MQPNVLVKINALDQSREAFNSLKRNLKNATQDVEQTTGGFSSLAKGLAKVAAAYFSVQKAYSTVALGIQIAADLETAEVGLATLLGSTEKAAETIARLKIEAARTPFELPGLTQATQLLTSVTKDGNRSIDILLDVGEALAAMGKGQAELDRLIVNLQQVAAVGKAASIDIKQFAFAGIPIYEMLADVTGKTGEELQAFIDEGGVTFDLLTQMFDQANDAGGRFFNAFANQSGSFNQAAANMKDSFGLMMADMVTSSGLFAGITEGMIRASSIMANWRGVVEGVRTNIAEFFTLLDEKTLLVTHLQGALDNLVVLFRTILKPAIDEIWIALQPLMPYLQALGIVIAGGLIISLHTLVAVFQVAAVAIAAVLSGLASLTTFIVDTATFAFRTLQNGVELLAAVFTGDWGGAITSVRNQIEDLVDWVKNLIDMFERAIDLAKDLGGGSIGFIKKVLPGRATGGPVQRSQPYIVGERGPELFVPGASGTIVPNGALQPSYATAAPIYVNISNNSFMGERDLAEKVGDQIISIIKRNQRL